jgi:hypothetical protein
MAKAQRVTVLKTEIDDKPGSLLTLMKDLKAKNAGVAGLWGHGAGDGKATLFTIAKNQKRVRAVLKASGREVEEGTGFLLKGTDKTGAMVKPLKALAEAGVNIGALDAIAVGGRFASFIWVDPADVDKAAKALGAK